MSRTREKRLAVIQILGHRVVRELHGLIVLGTLKARSCGDSRVALNIPIRQRVLTEMSPGLSLPDWM